MSERPTGYRLEYAPSNRSKCKGSTSCSGTVIPKGELRFGTLVEFRGAHIFAWRHWGCVTPKIFKNVKKNLSEPGELGGFEDLDEADKAKVVKAWQNDHVAEGDIPDSARKPEGEEEENIEQRAPGKEAAERKDEHAEEGTEKEAEGKPKKKPAKGEPEEKPKRARATRKNADADEEGGKKPKKATKHRAKKAESEPVEDDTHDDEPTQQIHKMLVEGPGVQNTEAHDLELDTHISSLAGGSAILSQVLSAPLDPSEHFDKLTDDNYHEWKIYMTAVLVRKRLFGAVDGPEGQGGAEGAKNVKRFRNRKARARAELILHVSPSQLIHCSHEDPAVIWTALAAAHAGYRRSTINSLRSRLYQLRLEGSETMLAFVQRALHVACLIKEAGGKVSNDDIIFPITTGLPSSYDSCIASFDTLPGSEYNLVTIVAELVSEYQRQNAPPPLVQETYMPSIPST